MTQELLKHVMFSAGWIPQSGNHESPSWEGMLMHRGLGLNRERNTESEVSKLLNASL